MDICIISGSNGLVGGTAVEHFHRYFDKVVGIDNDFRSLYFGREASTRWRGGQLSKLDGYEHYDVDISDDEKINTIFSKYGSDVKLVIHAAAQPSHDWAVRNPRLDYQVNSTGTLNMLEGYRAFSSDAVFIHCSTNKVYGDSPNNLPLRELELRYELNEDHEYFNGITELMSIDQSTHSLFGAGKLSADIYVQEYGRYFGLKTGVFRGGCLTGPTHSGAELHGFLSYLVSCATLRRPYRIYGYQGKQVRDNIHTDDLNQAFELFYNDPDPGAVYNIGGGRFSNCSILEAINIINDLSGIRMNYSIEDVPRVGDHKWYISSMAKFKARYPTYKPRINIEEIISQILDRPTP